MLTTRLKEYLQDARARYSRYMKGKRVVIVGPAPSILHSNQKEFIENFDDVLYNCMNPSPECGGVIDIDLLHQHNVKFLVSPYASYKEYRFGDDVLAFAKKNIASKKPINFCHIDTELFGRLMSIMKLPNTGVNAIIDVLQHDIKELYITGLTFFKGGYVKQYRGYSESQVLARMAKYKLHDQDKQLAYMRKLLRDNPRVKLDKALHEIIYEVSLPLQVDASIVKTVDASVMKANATISSKPFSDSVIIPATSNQQLISDSTISSGGDRILAVISPIVNKETAKIISESKSGKVRIEMVPNSTTGATTNTTKTPTSGTTNTTKKPKQSVDSKKAPKPEKSKKPQ
jgi:hypothetical protein